MTEPATELARRDPLGARPLVYARTGSEVVFAEHEHEVIAQLPEEPGPDPLALKCWIDRGTFPADRTLYEGVRRVPPGHRLVRSGRAVAVEPHWVPRYAGTVIGERDEIADWLRAEVFAAVARAATGPGLTALRLSGGLDSAAVAAGLAAARSKGAGVIALSVVFPDHPETDERGLIEATAAHLGLGVEQIAHRSGGELLPAARRHIERWRLPPASPNLSVWEPLMARVRELGAARILDGEGGDELFGTAPALIAEMLRRGRIYRAWELCGRIPGIGEHPDRALRLRAMRRFGLKPLLPEPALHRRRVRHARREPAGSLLGDADRAELAGLEETMGPPDGPLWWRELASTLTDADALGVAAQLRRGATDEGIEGRHPFLFDLELVEAILRTPPELGFDPLRDRPLMRDALTGYVPDVVRTRLVKAHFNPLLRQALLGSEGNHLLKCLGERNAPVRRYLDGAALDRLLSGWRGPMSGGVDMSLWRLGIADLWLRSLEGG